jgi:hypothetical protein
MLQVLIRWYPITTRRAIENKMVLSNRRNELHIRSMHGEEGGDGGAFLGSSDL